MNQDQGCRCIGVDLNFTFYVRIQE